MYSWHPATARRLTMRPSRDARFSAPTLARERDARRQSRGPGPRATKALTKSQTKSARRARKRQESDARHVRCDALHVLNAPAGIPNALATSSAGIIRNAHSSCKSNGSSQLLVDRQRLARGELFRDDARRAPRPFVVIDYARIDDPGWRAPRAPPSPRARRVRSQSFSSRVARASPPRAPRRATRTTAVARSD